MGEGSAGRGGENGLSKSLVGISEVMRGEGAGTAAYG